MAWQGLFAPAETPRPVLEALFTAVNQALQAPETQEQFAKQHFNIVPNKSLDDAKAWLDGELADWKKITSEVKISAQ